MFIATNGINVNWKIKFIALPKGIIYFSSTQGLSAS